MCLEVRVNVGIQTIVYIFKAHCSIMNWSSLQKRGINFASKRFIRLASVFP